MLVGWRHLNDGDIQWKYVLSEQQGNLAKKNRNIVPASVVDGFPDIFRNKQRINPEVVFVFSVGNNGISLEADAHELYIPEP